MNRSPRPRPALVILRIFQPDPKRAAAALARLLSSRPAKTAETFTIEPEGSGEVGR